MRDVFYLRLVVRFVPSGDLLPVALACRALAQACTARASLERQQGKTPWMTSITASVSRIRWAMTEWVPPEPTVKWCAAACARGDLEVLRWLRAHDVPWDSTAFEAAAEHGHVEVLEVLHGQRCPHGGELPYDAFGLDHDGEPRLNPALAQVAKEDELARRAGIRAAERAARNGQLGALQWLHDHGYVWSIVAWTVAARNKDIATLQWLYDHHHFEVVNRLPGVEYPGPGDISERALWAEMVRVRTRRVHAWLQKTFRPEERGWE